VRGEWQVSACNVACDEKRLVYLCDIWGGSDPQRWGKYLHVKCGECQITTQKLTAGAGATWRVRDIHRYNCRYAFTLTTG